MVKSSMKGPIYLSIAAGIWGGMYVVSKYALYTVPPMTLLFLRYFIASIILTLICFQKGESLRVKHWSLFVQVGAIGYLLSIAAQFFGTKYSSAHLGALITTLSPLFLSLFAMILLKEKLSVKQGMAMLAAFIGVIIIVGFPGSDGKSMLAGKIILLIAAISWGYYSVISRKASSIYSPLQISTIGIWIATFLSFPAVFIEWRQWNVHDLFDWPILVSVCYIGIISTAVAFHCWNVGLKLTPSHQAGIYFFLQPVVGSLLGWLILDEHLSLSFFIGSLFIIFGVYQSIKAEKPLNPASIQTTHEAK